jgi:hypothetical protein
VQAMRDDRHGCGAAALVLEHLAQPGGLDRLLVRPRRQAGVRHDRHVWQIAGGHDDSSTGSMVLLRPGRTLPGGARSPGQSAAAEQASSSRRRVACSRCTTMAENRWLSS